MFERPEETSEIGKLSLVVGGHVDEEDGRGSLEGTLMACLVRELAEEADLPVEPKPRPAGIALDTRSIAGSRHVGYIYLKDAERVSPKPESTEGGCRVSVLKRQEGVPVNLG